ncbi:hypothetical protein Pan153_33010 [Gimesia panareensis]|uniref:DUF1559 domain-containing protein n=1 Tax=Gimesia panareensis TaxID=2527978 RepID=A0A518FQL2_9PLAN|nr:hypothetical protein Pan153_33010 [Gimesia panareensis]
MTTCEQQRIKFQQTSASRQKYSLVKLRVVISSILLPLFLLAVQRSRKYAQCIKCLNHLNQMKLAFLNYKNAVGILSPFYLTTYKKTGSASPLSLQQSVEVNDVSTHSNSELLLPSLAQESLDKGIDFSISIFASTISTSIMLPNASSDMQFFAHKLRSTFQCLSTPRTDNFHYDMNSKIILTNTSTA